MEKEALRQSLMRTPSLRLPLESFRPAAVLIPVLAAGSEEELILTVRTAEVEHHKNQISFPGGRLDDGETLEEAALRETHEEVGITPVEVEVLGTMSDIYTISNYRVTPYVGWIGDAVKMIGNPREIALILNAPVKDLLDPAVHRSDEASWRNEPISLHFFHWRSHIIWGATGFLLDRFLTIWKKAA